MSVTKDELDQGLSRLGAALDQGLSRLGAALDQGLSRLGAEVRAELRAEFRGEMAAMEERLDARMRAYVDATADRVGVEAGMSAARVILEQHRAQIAVVDDKYRHLPGEVARLREDFEAHVRAPGVHKPARRSRSR